MNRPNLRIIVTAPIRDLHDRVVATNERGLYRVDPVPGWDPMPHWLSDYDAYLPPTLGRLLRYIARTNYGKDRGSRNFRRFSARTLGYSEGSFDSPLGVSYVQARRVLREAIDMGLVVELERPKGRRAGQYDLNRDLSCVSRACEFYKDRFIAQLQKRRSVSRKGLRKTQPERDLRVTRRNTERVTDDVTQNRRCVSSIGSHLEKESVVPDSLNNKAGAGGHPGTPPGQHDQATSPPDLDTASRFAGFDEFARAGPAPADPLPVSPRAQASYSGLQPRGDNQSVRDFMADQLGRMSRGEQMQLQEEPCRQKKNATS